MLVGQYTFDDRIRSAVDRDSTSCILCCRHGARDSLLHIHDWNLWFFADKFDAFQILVLRLRVVLWLWLWPKSSTFIPPILC